MAFTALYDACVLYPAPLRDIPIQLARTDLFHARWTDRIHEEWIRNLLSNRPDLPEAALRLTINAMNNAVADRLVTGYEELIPAMVLPDLDDRHVLATAVHGRADVIVTFNLKDFPTAKLAAHNIEAQHPDVFIRHALDLDTDGGPHLSAAAQDQVDRVLPTESPKRAPAALDDIMDAAQRMVEEQIERQAFAAERTLARLESVRSLLNGHERMQALRAERLS